MIRYVDRQGKAVTFAEWERLIADPAYTRVADAPDVRGYLVQAYWHGVCSDFSEPPKPFTLAVSSNSDETPAPLPGEESRRYATEQDLRRAFVKTVALLESTGPRRKGA